MAAAWKKRPTDQDARESSEEDEEEEEGRRTHKKATEKGN